MWCWIIGGIIGVPVLLFIGLYMLLCIKSYRVAQRRWAEEDLLPDVDRSKPPTLVGLWKMTGKDYSQRMLFYPDGQLIYETYRGMERYTKGSWKLDGKKLIVKYGHHQADEPGMSLDLRELTHDKLVFQMSGIDMPITYQRKKARE